MTQTEINIVKSRIKNILHANIGIAPKQIQTLLPTSSNSMQGKLYEAYVLALTCENLVRKEGLTIKLVNGSNLQLKQKGSPINRHFPYFEIYRHNQLFAELFTDIYFNTLSHSLKRFPTSLRKGDYHELDIALVRPGVTGYPKHTDILLAIECKNTSIQKSIIREVLGFRRELSLLTSKLVRTSFQNWPAKVISSDPNSVHMLYCSDAAVKKYDQNCLEFGIIIEHFKM